MRTTPRLLAALVAVLAALAVTLVVVPPAAAQGTVTVAVQGRGDVIGEGIHCSETGGPDCAQFYANSSEEFCDPELRPPCHTVTTPPTVSFTAGADRNGFAYDGFSGCDAVDGRTCTLTVSANSVVTATFDDVQPPTIGSVSPSSGVHHGTITLQAAVGDNAGVQRVEFRLRGVPVGTDTTAPYSSTFDTATTNDGMAGLEVRAFDAAGNVRTSPQAVFAIDNTHPTVTVESGPDGDVVGPGTALAWTFEATDATSGVAAVECSVTSVGTPASFGACSDGQTGHSVTRPEGTYELQVRATDNGGLATTSAARLVTVDETAPTLAVRGPGGTAHGPGPLAWTFSTGDAVGPVTTACSLARAGIGPSFGTCSRGTGGHSVVSLGDGSWTFRVRSTDAAGNTTTAPARTFRVDTVRPAGRIARGPAKKVTTRKKKVAVSFRLAASEQATYRCRLDRTAWRPCSARPTFRTGAGKHVLRVLAVDAVGNLDTTPAVRRWKVVRRR